MEDEIPAVLCEHANECPRTCPCQPNCYCRRVGSAPACKLADLEKFGLTGEEVQSIVDRLPDGHFKDRVIAALGAERNINGELFTKRDTLWMGW